MTDTMTSGNLIVSGNEIDPKVVVVCEPPSEKVWDEGKVMSPACMRVFQRQAIDCGFGKDDFCFITPCGYLPEDAATDSRVNKFLDTQREEFLAEYTVLAEGAKLVIYLGKVAGRQVLGRSVKITEVRGQVRQLEGHPAPILPLLSPGMVLRRPEQADIFNTDFRLAKQLRDAAWDMEAFEDAHLTGKYKWCLDLSEEIDLDNPPKAIALDAEWRVAEGKGILCVQLSWAKDTGVLIPLDIPYFNDNDLRGKTTRDLPYLTPRGRMKLVHQLRKLCANPDVMFCGHNMKGDLLQLRGLRVHVENWGHDTMQLAFVVDDNMQRKSLSECIRRWVPSMAGYSDSFDATIDKLNMQLVPHDDMCSYGGGDADGTRQLCFALVPLAKADRANYRCYTKIQMPALSMFFITEQSGLRMDQQALSELADVARRQEEELRESLLQGVSGTLKRRYLNDPANVNSTPSEILSFTRDAFVRDVLFSPKSKGGMGFKPKVFTKGTRKLPPEERIPSTSAKEHLPYFEQHEFVQQLMDYKRLSKMRTTYVGLPEHSEYVPVRLLKSGKAYQKAVQETLDANNYEYAYLPAIDGEPKRIRIELFGAKGKRVVLDGDGRPWHKSVIKATGFWQYLDEDSRIHPSFLLHRTVTGRSASANPNGQNIPKRGKTPRMEELVKAYRSCFVADDGFMFIECVAEDELVNMDGGLVPIQKADGLVNSGRRYRKILGRKDVGKRRVVSIEASDGSRIRVTRNHPFLVVRSGQYVWVPAGSLLRSDYVVVPDHGEDVCEVKAAARDESYWAGVFIGDGCYGKQITGMGVPPRGGYYRINFALGSDWKELYRYMESFFGIPPQIKSKGDVVVQSKKLYYEWIRKYPKDGSWFAEIPRCILESGYTTQMKFLAGLIDSDGSYHSRRMTYVSVSEKLIRQIHTMCRRLGIHGLIRRIDSGDIKAWGFDVFEAESLRRLPQGLLKRKRQRRGKYCTTKMFTQCRTAMIPADLLEARKQAGMQSGVLANRLFSNARRTGRATRDAVLKSGIGSILPLLDYRYLKVNGVTDAGTANVYDIEVEVDHCFEVGGFITHNCDLSQAELRLAAWMAQEPTMLQVYRNGGDIHKTTACTVLGITMREFNELPKAEQKLARFRAKAVNFGFLYGMGWRGFKVYAKVEYGIDMTDEEAEHTRFKFFQLYSGLEGWHNGMREFAMSRGYVRALHGALRRLPSVESDDEAIQGGAQRQGINCLSDDTEMLTARGWVSVDDLIGGEPVFSVVPETGQTSLDPLEGLTSGEVDRDMLCYDGTISAIATPNHRWLVDRYSQAKATKGRLVTEFKESSKLSDYGDHKIWLCGERWEGHVTGKHSLKSWQDDWVRLLGWVLTDGHYKHERPGCVGVTQSKEKNFGELENLFQRLGNHSYTVRKTGQRVWEITCAASSKIRRELPRKTLTPEVLFALTPDQRLLLHDSMLMGDGCWDSCVARHRRFVAGTKQRADMFLMLRALLGLPARAYLTEWEQTIKQYDGMGNIPQSTSCWVVELKQCARAQSGYGKSWKRWSGRVWCPTTKHGTWIAKRNGTVFVTGNSPIQRFASDIGLIGMTRFTKECPLTEVYPSAFIHDASVLQAREESVEEFGANMKWYLETAPLQEWFGIESPIPLLADVNIGYDLGHMTELEDIEAVRPEWAV